MMFSFGQSQQERIAVDVIRYEREASGEPYDDNWLVAQIEVFAGGFRGSTEAHIMTDEVARFASQLRPLYDTLSGVADFTTLEGQLQLHLSGDGKGHIDLQGEVRDRAGADNRLRFSLQFDQSQLAGSIRQLDGVLSAFPPRAI